MRFMKRLLVAVYLYLGIFFTLCLFCWIVTGEEPAALIAGISTAAGVESIITGCMRIREMQEERKREKDGQESGGIPGTVPPGTKLHETILPGKKMGIDPMWGEK